MENETFLDAELGTYRLQAEMVGRLTLDERTEQAARVDQSNLYATCEVDQNKQTIDGGCESGILLFCRNKFYPFLDTAAATKEIFEDICDCVAVLCAGLPSGENVSSGFDRFLEIFYTTFGCVASVALLIYLAAMADLWISGRLKGCKEFERFLFQLCHEPLHRAQQRLHYLDIERRLLFNWNRFLLNPNPSRR